MPKIYGGILEKNLWNTNPWLRLQKKLREQGLIQGVQLLVAHPHDLTIDHVPRGVWIADFEVFVHRAAENRGVDFGRVLDEQEVWRKYSQAKPNVYWTDYIRETMDHCRLVERHHHLNIPHEVGAVIHGGYTLRKCDHTAALRCMEFCQIVPGEVVVENVPFRVKKRWFADKPFSKHWPEECYGIGGNPSDMATFLSAWGGKMLLDFTHAFITANQQTLGRTEKKRERIIKSYLELPHIKVCHYSGYPPEGYMVDTHDYLDEKMPDFLVAALKEMEVVCLEIPYTRYDEVAPRIERFLNQLS